GSSTLSFTVAPGKGSLGVPLNTALPVQAECYRPHRTGLVTEIASNSAETNSIYHRSGKRAPMILTITPNPALDVTYHLPHAHWGDVNRVHRVSETPGGKGVNVARVLRQLGETVVCTGFLGGAAGDRLRRPLGDVDQRWVAVEQPTRRTTAVVTASDTTLFNEPGAPVDEAAWRRLTALVSELAGEGDVVVLSGSMPPDTPEHVVHTLVDTVVAHDARIIVDTSGPLLRVAARARATLVKPNRDELRAATG